MIFYLLFLLFLEVNGHGYLVEPKPRNLLAPNFYCPHCGQGLGPPNIPDICGNPYQNYPKNSDGSLYNLTNEFYGIQNTYKMNEKIKIKVYLSTNHGGRMSIKICPLPKEQATQECFDKLEHHLRRIDNNKIYWYLYPNDINIEKEFYLPKDIYCEKGCLLQWHWYGYQSCTLPCEDESIDILEECDKNMLNPSPYFPKCISETQTEQFKNCADIKILSSNPLPNISPNLSPNPSPKPSPNPSSKKYQCINCKKINNTIFNCYNCKNI